MGFPDIIFQGLESLLRGVVGGVDDLLGGLFSPGRRRNVTKNSFRSPARRKTLPQFRAPPAARKSIGPPAKTGNIGSVDFGGKSPGC